MYNCERDQLESCFHAMQPPERQQLYKNNTVLEDAKKLAELKVENDDILAVTFMQGGGWK